MNRLKTSFEQKGYLDPIRIFSPVETRDLWIALKMDLNNPPLDWEKGYAASSRLFFEIASDKKILDRVQALIGHDILLWGASIVTKSPGEIHPWHCDIENAGMAQNECVSVWIGLEHTSSDSSLYLIPFSHRFTKTVQQVRHEKGVARMQASTLEVLSWAEENDKRSTVVHPVVENGEALFFHGRIWHFSDNQSDASRSALLLQYATPATAIRIPDPNNLEWPFYQLEIPRPPCILLRGDDRAGLNQIVSPPVSVGGTQSRLEIRSSRIHSLTLPLPLPDGQFWKPYFLLDGRTSVMEHLTCHISSLRKGHQPHPPHAHREEEILIVLEGTVDVLLPEIPARGKIFRQRLRPGDFVYYPAYFPHTIESVSREPANYLMFKWYNQAKAKAGEMAYQFIAAGEDDDRVSEREIRYGLVFEGTTRCLEKLHCHRTVIQAGASYAAHIDPYDVAIVVLKGEVETLGKRVTQNGVIFYPSGLPHGMANPGQEDAHYLVFEFHGLQEFLPGKWSMDSPSELWSKPEIQQIEAMKTEISHCRSEVQSLRSSWSWKLGWMITRSVMKIVGWIPYFRNWVVRR
jgi:quercetin dioxygenase-like cupin family protein